MTSRIPAAVAAVLVLCIAGSAQAKGPINQITVCGANGCVTVKDASVLQKLPLLGGVEGSHTVGPAAPAPFYTVRLGALDDPYATEPVYYVPTAPAFRVKNPALAEWLSIPPAGADALAQATASLEPYAVPRLITVFVNELLARGAASYLRLFSIGRPVQSSPGADGWLSLLLLSKRPSPWGDGANDVWVSRHGSFVYRDGVIARVPLRVAERIRHRLPLA